MLIGCPLIWTARSRVGKDGATNFAELQDALSKEQTERLVYYAFDLLHLDGCDLTKLSLVQRKEALQALLAGLPKGSPVRYSDHVVGKGPSFFRNACKLRLEGIMGAKRRPSDSSAGRPGLSRCRGWIVGRDDRGEESRTPDGSLSERPRSAGTMKRWTDLCAVGS
jgi:hypothetical protein